MIITEVDVMLCYPIQGKNVLAFASVVLDDGFLVRDFRIIDSHKGPFVAMPDKKVVDRCPGCKHTNHLRARFCNFCGERLNENRNACSCETGCDKCLGTGYSKPFHSFTAHPVSQEFREGLIRAILDAYWKRRALEQATNLSQVG